MFNHNIGSFNPLKLHLSRPTKYPFPTNGDYGIYTSVEERPNFACPNCGLDSETMQERKHLKSYVGLIGRIAAGARVHHYSRRCIKCSSRIPWQKVLEELNIQFIFTFPTGPNPGVWAMASEITVITDDEYERLKEYADPKRTSFLYGQNNQQSIMRQRLPKEQWTSSQNACPECDGPKSIVAKLCSVCVRPHIWPLLSKEKKDQRIADVMRMRFTDGMSRTAIGAILGLSGSTIQIYERRGVRRLGIVDFERNPYRSKPFKEIFLEVQAAMAKGSN